MIDNAPGASKDIKVTPESEFQLLNLLRPTFRVKIGLFIHKAYKFASDCHVDQKRRSGEPYITHPLAVANINVTTLKLDNASVVAAILHDTVEDTSATIEDIQNEFGTEVAHLVDGLTKISKIKFCPSRKS